ncbi:MAG: DUF4160 domain-containing protein [Planctomycetales bacterium]|nr:DUF4160 domain-containing protein [Planctomycetales bacterium]
MVRIDFFYSGDREEPPHVHVERDGAEAKFWLDPVRMQRSDGFTSRALRVIEAKVVDNQQLLLDAWDEFFRD